MADITAVIEDLNRGVAEMRARIDEHEKALAKGNDDVVARETIDRINAQVGDHQKMMDQLGREMNAIRIGGTGGDGKRTDPDKAEHRKAFASWFRKGHRENELHGLAVKAALQTQVDQDGGFTVPTQVATVIERVLATRCVVRNYARKISISTGTYQKPINQGGAAGGWVTETGSRAATATPTINMLSFPANEIYAMPIATQTLLDDSAIDIEGWLGEEVGVVFAEYEGAAFVSGSGVGQPKGFTAETKVANASYAWGSIGYVASGAASTFHATTPGDNIIDLQMSLKAGYRQNGRFLMADSTAATVRKFKDGQGNYLWQPSFVAGQPQMLSGSPMDTDDNMATVAANAYPVAFADWSQAYLIVDRTGIRTLRDPYTNKPYVQFYTTKRVGGGVQNFEAIKLLKIATS